jgi:hypothetical protein
MPPGALVRMKTFLAVVFFASATSRAEPVIFESSRVRVALVELFTSEGCSSCPPADAWLSVLKSDPALWKKFVPVAFHVDYWNALGWPDRFASPEFTARQRSYAAAWRGDSVYTPCVVVNGREFSRWRSGLQIDDKSAPGILKATLEDGRVKIQFNGAGANEAHVALLGADISSEVKAGENRGRTLIHNFVVLSHESGSLDHVFTLPQSREGAHHALAVWVSAKGLAAPIQAVGGWLH